MNVISPKCVTTCVAKTKVIVTSIPIGNLKNLIPSNPGFEEKLYLASTDHLVQVNAHKAGVL